MAETAIEWTAGDDGTPGKTWNPVRGCSRISPGCGGPGPNGQCYAERMAARFSKPGLPFHGYAKNTPSGPRWTGKVDLIPDKLREPASWKKPARIFVNSMSDLFHEDLGVDDIQAVFDAMGKASQHTYIILTKRAERMAKIVPHLRFPGGQKWEDAPSKNVWLGVSVEDQEYAELRIPHLLRTPAAVRLLSVEPLLGPVDLSQWLQDPCNCAIPALEGAGQHHPACRTFKVPWGLDWVIVGAQSGFRPRPMSEDWVRTLRDQCVDAGTKFFFKQAMRDGQLVSLPELDGRKWAEFPLVRD